MARLKDAQMTMESFFFVSPEQKVLRFLLSEPTTSFTPRVLSSKLKGVRGLGGAEGILKILGTLENMKLVEFIDNRRAVRIQEDHPAVRIQKSMVALCDLESLRERLASISSSGILYGSWASGKAHSDSPYDLFVVSESLREVQEITGGHPLGRRVNLQVRTSDNFHDLERQEPQLAQELSQGVIIWGSGW